jgi:P-type E1-E2 ATPase
LTFAGFFICSSPLKEDTLKNIQQLQKAQYKILIITGDNILTAIKVGLTLQFGTEAWTLEKINDQIIL